MASRAPLVLAAALFVLGIAGLVQTVRQTGGEATSTPLTDLALRPLPPIANATGAGSAIPTTVIEEAVSDVSAPPPAADAAAPRSSASPSTLTAAPNGVAESVATVEPTPESHGGAIAAGLASDGDATTPASANGTPLHPLRLGMIASGEAGETAEPTPAGDTKSDASADDSSAPTAATPVSATPTP